MANKSLTEEQVNQIRKARVDDLERKYNAPTDPELDVIMEKPAKKIARKPKREPIAKKTKKPPKIFFKNGIAHDVDTGKPL